MDTDGKAIQTGILS